jgi:hypothetical protein
VNASQAGRIAALSRDARGLANTAPARDALEAKFRAEVDPDGTLPPAELAKRVAKAKSLHYTRLSQKRWQR